MFLKLTMLEFPDVGALGVVFGVGLGLVEVLYYVGYGVAVEAAELVHLLLHLAVLAFDEAAVEAVGDGGEVGGVLEGSVIRLYFGLGEPGAVEVAGRGGDQVGVVGLVDALGEVCRVEHHLDELGLGIGVGADAVELRLKEGLRELGRELVHGVVVVYAVAEPHLLHVLLERLEIGAVAVAVVGGVDVFERAAQGQVRGAVLVPEDVAAPEGCFGEVVDERLLVDAEAVEIGHLVAEHFDVGEAVGRVVEIGVGRSLLLVAGRGHDAEGQCCHCNDSFHLFKRALPAV